MEWYWALATLIGMVIFFMAMGFQKHSKKKHSRQKGQLFLAITSKILNDMVW